MWKLRLPCAAICIFFCLPGCGGGGMNAAPEPPLPAGHNPLGGGPGEDALLPFPSSAYLKKDPTTGTGYRVALPAALLPQTRLGKGLDPTTLNRGDGFSPATRLLAYFPQVLDGGNLPPPGDVGQSVAAGSPVLLLRYDSGERVPLFAELDQNANLDSGERQTLLIQPVVRLQPGTRYVVALRGLRGKDGKAVPPLSGFAALRDGRASASGPRGAEIARFGEIFAALSKAGIARQDLQLAWDFVTATDDPITGRMVRLRDQAYAAVEQGAQAGNLITVSTVKDLPHPDDPHLARQIIGTFQVPSFLTEDSQGGLKLGPDGEPQLRGPGQFPLVIHVSQCAMNASAPVPVMLYGHGLFGTALDEMDSSYQRAIIDRLCMVQIGTNWLGLAADDVPYVAGHVISDFNNFSHITDRLQQAHVNVAALARLVKLGVLDALPALQVKGKDGTASPLTDKTRLYYYGISDGGIQGATALALSSDYGRGALNVPGGFWSLLMYRSADFSQYATLIAGTYPDAIDRQLLVLLTQPLWDYTDPATYARHLLADPLPGSSVKPLLYQEGRGDGQVSNQATRAMVRTIGLPLMTPKVEAVYGVKEMPPPLPSAYVQFDVGQMPLPGATNVPPPDNPVHEAIRRLEAAQAQLQGFLQEGGQVQDTCNGKPCVFKAP